MYFKEITLFSFLFFAAAVCGAAQATPSAAESSLTEQWFEAAAKPVISLIVPQDGDHVRTWVGADGRKIVDVVQIPHPKVGAPTIKLDHVKDGEDARPAFESAIAQAKKTGARWLSITKGVYTFKTAAVPTQMHLLLSDLSDFTIEGNGSTFVFTGAFDGIDLLNANRVRIRDLNFEYNFRTYSLATMQNQNGKPVLVVDANYPVTARDQIGHLHEFDRACNCRVWKTLPKRYYFSPSIAQPVYLGNQTYSSPYFDSKDIGKSFLLFHHYYAGAVIKVAQGNDITLRNINIYSGPGMGIAARHVTRGLAILDSSIIPKSGSLVSTEYDGMFITAGGDVIIDNNTGIGLGDDFVNVNSSPHTISTVSSDHKTFSMNNDARFIKVGDVLYFFDANNKVLGVSSVHSVAQTKPGPISSADFTVVMDSPVPNVDANSIARNVRLMGSRIMIEHNRVKESFSIVDEEPNAMIYANIINHTINLGPMHGTFIEGTGAINVRVLGNTLWNNSPYENNLDMPWSSINVFGKLSKQMSVEDVNRNIIISNNAIAETPVGCMSVSSSSSIVLTDNLCLNTNSSQPTYNPNGNVVVNSAQQLLPLTNIAVDMNSAAIKIQKSRATRLHNNVDGASHAGVYVDDASKSTTDLR